MKTNILFTLLFAALLSGFAPVAFGQCNDAQDYNTVAETAEATVQQPVFNKALMPYTPASPNNNLRRKIFWLHGLGANHQSWVDASGEIENTPAYNVKCYAMEYNGAQAMNSLLSVGHHIHGLMDNTAAQVNPAPDAQNIVIGHSLGGIMAREIDMIQQSDPNNAYPSQFGGIVTFGTPHQGGHILDHTAEMEFLAAEACSSLTEGPLLEKLAFLDFLHTVSLGIIPKVDVQNFVNTFICGTIPGKAIDIIQQHNNQDIADAIKPSSTELATLNAYSTPTYKVAFYGEEDDPIFFRTAYYLFITKPQQETPWDAIHDDIAVDWANNSRSGYDYKKQLYTTAYAKFKSWQPGIAITNVQVNGKTKWLTKNQCLDRKRAFSKGVAWWDDANDLYQASIGAINAVPVYATSYECTCDYYDFGGNFTGSTTYPVTDPNDCTSASNGYTSCNSTITGSPVIIGYDLTYHPSDGVVLSQSAMNMPFATHPPVNLNDMQNPKVGSSHPQMRNDWNAKLAFDKLFQDGLYGQFFELD